MKNSFRVLIPFGIPQAGSRLLLLAEQITISENQATEVTPYT